jgi:dihydrofolate reductase
MTSIIVAAGENNEIGKDNDLLWRLPNDLKFFKEKTLGHHVIMGKRTFESIPNQKPLPKRTNIVVTHDESLLYEGCVMANSIEDAVSKSMNDDERFILGGATIYRQFLSIADKIYLTRVHATFDDADTYFPNINFDEWKEVERTRHEPDEKHKYAYSFITLVKK